MVKTHVYKLEQTTKYRSVCIYLNSNCMWMAWGCPLVLLSWYIYIRPCKPRHCYYVCYFCWSQYIKPFCYHAHCKTYVMWLARQSHVSGNSLLYLFGFDTSLSETPFVCPGACVVVVIARVVDANIDWRNGGTVVAWKCRILWLPNA